MIQITLSRELFLDCTPLCLERFQIAKTQFINDPNALILGFFPFLTFFCIFFWIGAVWKKSL